MAADVTSTFSSLSSTESGNQPSGTTAVGTNLDDNIRMCQALMAAWRDQTGWGVINLASVSGTNTVTATLSTAGSVTFGPTALSSGMRFRLIPANSNTTAVTINITSPAGGSALGAKNVYLNNNALTGYEMRKNCPVIIDYDGTTFHIIAGAHGGDGIPIGSETNRYYSTAPNGHLLMDGSEVSQTTYADLYAVLGTTYNTGGESAGNFRLPNAARRVSVGSGGSGTSTLANTVGSTGGEETHLLTGAESGTSAHSHTMFDGAGAIGSTGNGARFVAVTISNNNVGPVGTDAAVAANASSAHNIVQPSIVVYKCIKY